MNAKAEFLHPGLLAPGTGWARRHVADLLRPAGLTLDGPRACDPQIRRTRAYWRVLFGGTLGAGESFVAGDWDCAALDEFTARLLAADADAPLARLRVRALLARVRDLAVNPQTRARARADIRSHYDLDDDLYAAMLGRTRAYSCAYWRNASTLDEAQDAKHELIARKLALRPGMRVLDIGCGWGAFARHAAERHGVRVVGLTISPAQAAVARARCAAWPVDIRLSDYRDVTGRFDRVVSVGMFEHVGPTNYRRYFDTIAGVLEPDGLALLHTIGGRDAGGSFDPWIAKYIFPHAVLPSAEQVAHACTGRFVIEDWENLGADYDRTLLAWHRNIDQAWLARGSRFSAAFRRLWRYYLLTCAGTFRARRNQLWQIVLAPHGQVGGYRRPLI